MKIPQLLSRGDRMLLLFVALYLFFVVTPYVALAQSVTVAVNSPWRAWTSDITANLAASPLRRNATTHALEAVPGQKVQIGRVAFLQSSVTVVFPGQASAPMQVAGVRLFHSASGSGWSMPEHPINLTFPAVISVPAGRRMICQYNMPLFAMGSVACAATVR